MPPGLTAADVDRIAALARLELTAAERERFAGELAAILEYAGQLLSIDTSSIEETTASGAPGDALRADERRPCLDRADALGAAPRVDDAGQFVVVPRVIG